jgi:hypothetical protein
MILYFYFISWAARYQYQVTSVYREMARKRRSLFREYFPLSFEERNTGGEVKSNKTGCTINTRILSAYLGIKYRLCP